MSCFEGRLRRSSLIGARCKSEISSQPGRLPTHTCSRRLVSRLKIATSCSPVGDVCSTDRQDYGAFQGAAATLDLGRVSAKQFFADRPPASTEPLRRAAETGPEAASLHSTHPGNVDGAILLVHLLGR